jgi:hypothetical protein
MFVCVGCWNWRGLCRVGEDCNKWNGFWFGGLGLCSSRRCVVLFALSEVLVPFVLSVLRPEGRDLGASEESVSESSSATTEGEGETGLPCAGENMLVTESTAFLTVDCEVF